MAPWNDHIPHFHFRRHLYIPLNTSAVNNSTIQGHPSNSSSTSAFSSSDPSKATKALIAELQLAQVQSVRTANIVLGSFSLVLILITIHRIISDARRAAALQVQLRKHRFAWTRNVHTAETFPLVLACSAVIQLLFIIGAQSTTLYTIYSNQGKLLAALTLPTIFLVGYTTLVFGFEMAWRAIRRDRFGPRGTWNTPICIGVVSLLVIITFIPTVASPSFARCFGGLIFFSATKFNFPSFVILVVMVSLFLLLAAVLTIQLMRTPEMDPNERISASRIVLFLVVAAVIYGLVIPVEVLTFRKKIMTSLSAAVVAEGSLFSVGIVISFAHLFLRANATRMAIMPINDIKAAKKQPDRPRIRLFGPSDLHMNISGPMAFQTSRRPESRQGLIDVGLEKTLNDFEQGYFERSERVLTPTSANSLGSIDPTKWPLPPDDDEKNARYSLFPTRAEDVPRLPATVYKPQDPSRVSKFRRFTSRSSITNVSDFLGKTGRSDSIATVQIGLRFSLGPAVFAMPKSAQTDSILPPPLQRNETESSGESLGLPIQSPTSQIDSSAYLQAQREKLLPSPLFSKSAAPTPRSASPVQALEPEPPVPEIFVPEAIAPAAPILPVLRMSPLAANPPTPSGSPSPSRPSTPASIVSVASITPSPNARIPLGAGTMPRGGLRKQPSQKQQ